MRLQPSLSLPAALLLTAAAACLAPGAQAQDIPTPTPAPEEAKLTFSFKRGSVQAFLGYLSREAGFTFIEEAGVTGDFSAVAEKPLTRSEALEVLRAWLLPKGRTLLRTGDVVRIVTMEEAKRRGLPVKFGADPEGIHDSEELITQVMPLKYVRADEVKTQLEGLLSDQGKLLFEGTSNSLIISDTSASIRRFAQVLGALDRAVTAALHVKVYRLRNAASDEVARVVRELFTQPASTGGAANRGGGNRGGRGGRGGGGGGGGPDFARMAEMFMGGGGGGGGQQGSGATMTPVNVAEDARTNSVVVTATADQLKLVDQLVAELDKDPDPVVTEIRAFRLENADATELAQTLNSLFQEQQQSGNQRGGNQNQRGGGGGGNQPPPWVRQFMGGAEAAPTEGNNRYAPQPKFTTDSRTNTLIASATQSHMAVIQKLVSDLDKDPTERAAVLVVPLQHANATSLSEVMAGVLAEQASGGQGQNRNAQNRQGQNQNRNAQNRQNQQQSPFGNTSGFGGGNQQNQGGGGGGMRFQQRAPGDGSTGTGLVGDVTVVPDEESNALVFTSSPRNFERLRQIVRELDTPRREVFIECLIAEVQLNDKGELGIQWNAAFENSLENAEEGTQSLGTDFGLDSLTDGLRYTTTSDKLTGLLRALKTEGRLNILSSPKILVVENASAELSVGQEVPYVTNSRVTTNGDTVNTIQYRNVGIILQVTPQVNDDGHVKLVVHPEVSSIAPDSQSVPISEGVRSPTFNRNFADTTIVIRSGETAVIGGLIQDALSETKFRIPFLGDVPVLGHLFGNTIKEVKKQEIVVFLTPHVIERAGQLRTATRVALAEFAYAPRAILDGQLARWLDGLDVDSHAWSYNRGTVLLETGRTEESIQTLLEAARRRPDHCSTRVNLGLALAHGGRLEEAERELRWAEQLDPRDPDICYDLGSVLWRRGDYLQAALAFRRALLVDPTHDEALHWLPRAQREADKVQRAAEARAQQEQGGRK